MPGKRAAEWVWPAGYPRRVPAARTAGSGATNRRAVRGPQPRAPQAVHACQAAAQGPPPLSPGRGVAKQRGHRPGRWRYSPMVAMAAAAATAQKCHLRSLGCMPGEQAAGTAAGLAPRGGRGLRWLRSGPPPPPQAPAPAAAGRCGMSRVARYIPGAPRLGPARPRRRHSARPPASPEVQKSLRPATVLHLRNAPKNKPLGAQLASLSVTHVSIRQSQAAAGPWHHPHSPWQPIARRKSDLPAPPPAHSQRPHSQPPANHDEPIPPTLTGCQWAKSRRFPRAV